MDKRVRNDIMRLLDHSGLDEEYLTALDEQDDKGFESMIPNLPIGEEWMFGIQDIYAEYANANRVVDADMEYAENIYDQEINENVQDGLEDREQDIEQD